MLKLDKKTILFVVLILSCSLSFPLFLGDGTDENTDYFIKVLDSGVEKVIGEGFSTCITKEDGSLWTTGVNGSNVFVKISDSAIDKNNALLLTRDKKLIVEDKNNFCIAKDVRKICHSWKNDFLSKEESKMKISYHFIFIKTDDSLWSGYWLENSKVPVLKKITDNVIDYDYGSGTLLNKKGELFRKKDFHGTKDENERLNKLYSTDFKDLEGSEYHRVAKNVKNFSECYAYVTTRGDLFIDSNFLKLFKKNKGKIDDNPFSYEKFMTNVEECKIGSWSMMILKNDGNLYGMAANNVCTADIGIKIENNDFSKAYFIADNVKNFMVATGWSGIVKKDGSLWMCGINNQKSLDARCM